MPDKVLGVLVPENLCSAFEVLLPPQSLRRKTAFAVDEELDCLISKLGGEGHSRSVGWPPAGIKFASLMRQGLKVINHFVPKGRTQAGPNFGGFGQPECLLA